jgi:hypothetical protein
LTRFAGTGIDIEAGTVIPFREAVTLDTITITEGHVGFLAMSAHTVRLTAPVGYSWDVARTNLDLDVTAGGRIASVTAGTATAFVNHNGRHELLITVSPAAVAPTHPLRERVGYIEIDGLRLAANWNTQPERYIDVDVRVASGTVGFPAIIATAIAPPAITMVDVVNAFNTWTTTNWVSAGNLVGSELNLRVARHVREALWLETVGDELPVLRSGYALGVNPFGPLVETNETWATEADYTFLQANPRLTTGRTAVLRVNESVPNALDLARLRPITFTLPEEVIVTGVEWRYYLGTDAPDWTIVPRPALNNPQHGDNQNVIFQEDNVVILRPDLTEHPGTFALRPNTMRLEIRFFVSVPFGYENNVDSALDVTVTGPGVYHLTQDGSVNNIDVAEVADPVTIEHVGDKPQVNLVGREQNIYHTEAGAIVITEVEAGALQIGTRFWVDLVTEFGIGHNLIISDYTLIVDQGSGLGFAVRQIPTASGVTRFEFEVTRESRDGYPGSVTLDALTLFGHVYQGERYWLIASGPAFAENHAGVLPGVNENTPGLHFVHPFSEEIIDLTGTGENRANSLAGRTFSPATMVEGASEMIWHRAPGMVHEGGFVGLRAFANIAGVDPATGINWVSTSRVASIQGWDWQGNWVTITMTQGSPWAQITRGSTAGASDILITRVDIADFAEGQTGPSGTVVPVFQNNRIYVPFRFVFNAFGYSADFGLERDGQVARVTTLS